MRTYGAAPRRLARPLTVGEIHQIIGGIDWTTPIGVRDAAIILLGFASAMRRSEIVALSLVDVEYKPAGLLLNVRKSKMDQEGYGQVVAVAHGQHALTDPVAALGVWRVTRGEISGAVHPNLGELGQSRTVVRHVVARMPRARAEAAGLDGTRITAHSLRAGHATAAAMSGVPLDRIAAQTPHKDLNVLVNRYIRPLEALATTSSRDLGL